MTEERRDFWAFISICTLHGVYWLLAELQSKLPSTSKKFLCSEIGFHMIADSRS